MLEVRAMVAASPTITPLSTYATGEFDKVAAEVPAYDAETQRIFANNSAARGVDVLDTSAPSHLQKLFTIDTSAYGEQTDAVAAWDAHRMQAMPFVLESRPGKHHPFDLVQQSDRTRDLYAREEWGQGVLVARRLLEAGVRKVASGKASKPAPSL